MRYRNPDNNLGTHCIFIDFTLHIFAMKLHYYEKYWLFWKYLERNTIIAEILVLLWKYRRKMSSEKHCCNIGISTSRLGQYFHIPHNLILPNIGNMQQRYEQYCQTHNE